MVKLIASTRTPGGRYRIQAIDRAARIMACFDFDQPELSVTDIAARTHLPKSTAHRILMALQHNGLIEQDTETGLYHLGLELFRLGHLAVARLTLRDIARPLLEDLSEQVGETVHLAVLEGEEVLYVDTIEAAHALRMPGRVGHRIPTYCTSLGKAMLSCLPDEQVRVMLYGQRFRVYTPKTIRSIEQLLRDLAVIRKRGWSLDDEEIETGLRCIGAPLRDHAGALAGAISIAGPSARLRVERVADLALMVRRTAEGISAGLGYGRITEPVATEGVSVR
jgi:DNA-binding IclR family transcriptional regulator